MDLCLGSLFGRLPCGLELVTQPEHTCTEGDIAKILAKIRPLRIFDEMGLADCLMHISFYGVESPFDGSLRLFRICIMPPIHFLKHSRVRGADGAGFLVFDLRLSFSMTFPALR